MNRQRSSFSACMFACVLFMPAPVYAADPALVQIEQVEVRHTVMGPVVLLKAQQRAIPVFVDPIVAESIAAALSGQQLARPLTHNLMRTILEAFEGKVTQAVITLKDAIFYADLTIVVRGTAKVFDSRSSDAVALAIHFKAPVLVSRQLLQSQGLDLEQLDGGKQGEKGI